MRVPGRYLLGMTALVAAASASVGVVAAGAGSGGCGATVRAMAGERVAINRYVQDDMHFSPGTVTIKSGCTLTFEYGSPGQTDPHTLSIVAASELPRTPAQIDDCKVCEQIGARHVKNPTQPPGPTNPVLHWTVNAGRPGLDAPGDSRAILEGPGAPSGHKSISIEVTAPPGTTLHFLCAVHPWMQGTIKVT